MACRRSSNAFMTYQGTGAGRKRGGGVGKVRDDNARANMDAELNDHALDPDTFAQFDAWYRAAEKAGVQRADAMVLATATREGIPSARYVLLKGVDGHGFRFFTNLESRKGRELAQNPRGALVLYWQPLNRQVVV